MTVGLYVKEALSCAPEDYWRVFRSGEYQRCLFLRELRYARYDVTWGSTSRGGTPREVDAEPGGYDVPDMIRGLLSYVEHGQLVGEAAYLFSVRSPIRHEALTFDGQIRVLAKGARWGGGVLAERSLIFEANVEVSLFGFGDGIEKRLAFETKRSMWIAARLAELWAQGKTWQQSAAHHLSEQADRRFKR